MDLIWKIDWHTLLVPAGGLADIFLRGTLTYFFLLMLLRFFRRQAGAVAIADVLVIVLLADASQNAMSHEYKSITEGALLVSTIIFWDFFVDWLGYRLPIVEKLLRPSPLLLIKDGRMLRRNMRQEFITPEELMTQLREQGLSDMSSIRRAYLEDDGRFSILRNDEKKPQ